MADCVPCVPVIVPVPCVPCVPCAPVIVTVPLCVPVTVSYDCACCAVRVLCNRWPSYELGACGFHRLARWQRRLAS